MKKILIAIMFASIAAFADNTVQTSIEQLIAEKNWNVLSTNSFDSSIVKTWQTTDAEALVEAAIQNKFYYTAYSVATVNSRKPTLIAACQALANNNFITKKNGTCMTIHWSNSLDCYECRDVVISMVAKLRQILAENIPANIENVNLPAMCNFIMVANNKFNLEKTPLQISDSIIRNSAFNYIKQPALTIKNSDYSEQYAQIYAKYFAALPENSDLAIRQNVTWEKLSYINWLNKYYGTQFNDILYAKSNFAGKLYIAVETSDADKVLDVLEFVKQDTLDAETTYKMIVILNGQKADWRQADVLKALKNINSMYTIRLYDDRDAWEPVLSKLRAMIEVRQ